MERHGIIGADAFDFGLAAALSQEQFSNCKPNEDTEPKKDSDTDSGSSDIEKPETEEIAIERWSRKSAEAGCSTECLRTRNA